jgi:hypothetical protein
MQGQWAALSAVLEFPHEVSQAVSVWEEQPGVPD